MTFNASAWGHDGKTYNADSMRALVATLTGSQGGVAGGTNAGKVSQQTSPANTVKVAEGGLVIPATGAGLVGSYHDYNDGDLTSPVIAPTSANGRKDRLIARVTAGVTALEVVQGTPAGSPTEPALTGDNYLELALITLPGSTTNITDAMITDRRVRFATAPSVVTSATRPASPFEGQQIYEIDTDREYVYSGTAWTYRSGGTNPTAARAHMSSDKNLPGPATWTQIDTFTEDYDYGAAFASNAYTVPSAGLFDLKTQINVAAANNPQTLVLGIFVDGVETYHGTDQTIRSSVSGDAMQLIYADQVELAAGQVLTVRVYNTQASTCVAKGTSAASSFFAIRRVF